MNPIGNAVFTVLLTVTLAQDGSDYESYGGPYLDCAKDVVPKSLYTDISRGYDELLRTNDEDTSTTCPGFFEQLVRDVATNLRTRLGIAQGSVQPPENCLAEIQSQFDNYKGIVYYANTTLPYHLSGDLNFLKTIWTIAQRAQAIRLERNDTVARVARGEKNITKYEGEILKVPRQSLIQQFGLGELLVLQHTRIIYCDMNHIIQTQDNGGECVKVLKALSVSSQRIQLSASDKSNGCSPLPDTTDYIGDPDPLTCDFSPKQKAGAPHLYY